jgi:hypothetical protein
MEHEDMLPRLSRRDVIKWFAAAAAASQASPFLSFGQANDASIAAKGYGKDPLVTKFYQPGDVWPLTFDARQRQTTTALADVILPEDEYGPAASALRVPDFIDEWISAPYPKQQSSRKTILPGLKWIDEESNKRFNKNFADLSASQKKSICDDLCDPNIKDPQLKKGASFFRSFTSLCMGAYYGTPEGWKAIGYVGNLPSATFDGPPQAVLDRLGLEQTVK